MSSYESQCDFLVYEFLTLLWLLVLYLQFFLLEGLLIQTLPFFRKLVKKWAIFKPITNLIWIKKLVCNFFCMDTIYIKKSRFQSNNFRTILLCFWTVLKSVIINNLNMCCKNAQPLIHFVCRKCWMWRNRSIKLFIVVICSESISLTVSCTLHMNSFYWSVAIYIIINVKTIHFWSWYIILCSVYILPTSIGHFIYLKK